MMPKGTDDPYEPALVQLIADREALGEVLRRERQRVLASEEKSRKMTSVARDFLKMMPRAVQAKYLREYPWLAEGPDPASRQAVLVGIVTIFLNAGSRTLTPPDVEVALAKQGIHANSKRILNTLNYLIADHRLERPDRGIYKAGKALLAMKPTEVPVR
jgi:hypothetical protein